MTKRIFFLLLAFFAGAVVASGWFLMRELGFGTPSVYASRESTEATDAMMDRLGPHLLAFATGDIDERRAILDEYYFGPGIEQARRLYPVSEQTRVIEGVYTEVFEPAGGVPERNRNRVLVNLHSGGFTVGSRTGGRLESIPVASVAGMKVVSVDYRQGPEHRFPAASEDVTTVYRYLLRTHKPDQIGIFGCSAGGLLAAQSLAWFDAHDLPMPGAIGVFCAGAGPFGHGDSVPLADALGAQGDSGGTMDYFEGVEWHSPLLTPMDYPQLLARFPPSLIITSTRDMAMSAAVATHQRLIAAGTESDLHVYEGLLHYFFADTAIPESRQVFAVVADFFDRWLAR